MLLPLLSLQPGHFWPVLSSPLLEPTGLNLAPSEGALPVLLISCDLVSFLLFPCDMILTPSVTSGTQMA
jgi:hypothetical protein